MLNNLFQIRVRPRPEIDGCYDWSGDIYRKLKGLEPLSSDMATGHDVAVRYNR